MIGGERRSRSLLRSMGRRTISVQSRSIRRTGRRRTSDRFDPSANSGRMESPFLSGTARSKSSVSWFSRPINSSARMALWVGFGARLEHDRLARLRLTTLNLNLFGSPTRSDYRFVIRSGRPMEKARQFWNSESQFGLEMRWASGEGIASGRLNEYRRSAA